MFDFISLVESENCSKDFLNILLQFDGDECFFKVDSLDINSMDERWRMLTIVNV